jgi:ComF family protein
MRWLLEALLPARCFACGRDPGLLRGGVCANCWEKMPERPPARCPLCDVTMPGGESASPALCTRCSDRRPVFDRLAAAAPYRSVARSAVLALKFRGADYLGRHLARLMAERLETPGAASVIGVPSTRRKRRTRGYNPADVLAREVARTLRLPLAPRMLMKVRETSTQSLLPLAERFANVQGAFRARSRVPKRVLLIDDVATSGATAASAARALREGGAREVLVWAFARALPGEDS